ncbi:glucose 1-dehydrogenase [Mucilaginibacter ginkgonis]|uniref:Glucose 1-dehydrogenase n=1 Tax=Mucilaginibacter ginkgonis TaxID=2682091 RepID=A0A6I4HZM2_9SPHI|nr:glucose 1-dehydrogenase [Mucilaginibacter ginkgonis]QQL48885.1 glucose 1-dehydrogenase [Mucilaginibacter ginkgonis]
MKRLENKVAVVTGASKGIGADIAKKLSSEGASVVVNYSSDKSGADKVVVEITNAGGKAIAVQANVSVETDIKRLFAETNSTYGNVDILVNNAGVYNFVPLGQITADEFHRQFNTNVLGLLLVTQEAAKNFNDGGSIINIGSAVTKLNIAGSSIYTATKSSVESITNVLSKELGPRKIRVNTLAPGMVETEGSISAGLIGSDFQTHVENTAPLGRIGQPEDISNVAAFLASDESGWLTGEVLFAAGGAK